MECKMDKISIAIDGPAGSGKSTVAKCVAKKMGITYLDTGAMYRAVTYAVISNNIAFTDLKSIQTIVENIEIDFIDGELHLNGENVNEAIRLPNINQKCVSHSILWNCKRKTCFYAEKRLHLIKVLLWMVVTLVQK